MGAHRRLSLLRHGRAGPALRGAEDRTRVLDARGAREVEEMGTRLRSRGLVPGLILASPAARTWASAEIIAQVCGLGSERLRAVDELYLADPATLWRAATTCDTGVRHLLICAHNPGISELAARFAERPRTHLLPTAGLASAVWEQGEWHELKAHDADHCDYDEPRSERASTRIRL